MATPRLIRWLLLGYPPALRRAHGDEIALAVADDWRRRRGFGARLHLMGMVTGDLAASWWRAITGRDRDGRRALPARGGGWRGLDGDVRDARRLFTRAPLLAASAVLTLGLGIGAVTAIFSLADAVLLRPLPLPHADRVLQVRWSWAYPDFRDFEARQKTFVDVAAWATLNAGLEIDGRTEIVKTAAVSSGFIRIAAQRPVIGRLLDERDESRDAPIAMLLGERVWTRLFGRDPAAVGRTYNLNRRPVTVVGILPARFRGFSLSEVPEVFLPLPRNPEIATGFLGRPTLLTSRNAVWLSVAGRLRDGGTAEQAELDVQGIYRQLHPPKDPASPAEPALVPLAARALGLDQSSDLRRFLLVLIGATVLTLALACATVANLLLVRAERRYREFAVRAALGAGRARLLRLLMSESLAIGLAGALLALGVAKLTLALLGTFSLPGGISIASLDLTLNSTVFGLALALGAATSVLFGLAPLWPVARLPLTATLRDGSRGSARQPLRSVLVTAQVALCVVLLGGGLVFGRAVRQALALDRGFDADGTVLIAVDPTVVRYTRARKATFQRTVLERLSAEPWVRAAAWSSLPPLSGRMVWTLGVPGYAPTHPDELTLDANVVTEAFFDAMGIRLVAGRAFEVTDVEAAPKVAVVSEGFARKFWPAGSAVGQEISLDPDAKPQVFARIVGVAGDVRRGLERQPDPTAYFPLAQHPDMLDFGQQRLIVRGTLTAEATARNAAAITRQVDPLVPVTDARPIREHVRTAAMAQRLGLTLFALLAGLAVVLTSLGVYAVVAYAIARRTREIGIRMALGARAPGVLGLVVRQGLRPVGVGLAVGCVAFYLGGRSLQAFAMALPVFNVPTLIGLAGGIALIAVVAMIMPARRALSIDPARALRED